MHSFIMQREEERFVGPSRDIEYPARVKSQFCSVPVTLCPCGVHVGIMLGARASWRLARSHYSSITMLVTAGSLADSSRTE